MKSGERLITANPDGDNNYLPAISVSQLLIIKNNNATISKITIGSVTYENPSKTITHLMDCGETNLDVTILNEMNATLSSANSFII